MQQSASENIRYSVEDKVFVMQIHRPEKKNALLPEMYKALADGIKLADSNAGINVIVLRGTDDCFTSGNDVNSFVGASIDDAERPSVQFMHAMNNTNKPLIAAVSGLAIGIGTTALFHCDMVYAAENCFLQLPFARLGLCPEAGSSYLLPRLVGHLRAAELLLLGDRFSAQRAFEYGIVTEVLSQSDYLEYAMSKAKELAALPPAGVQTSKRLMKQGVQQSLPQIIDVELKEFAHLLQSEDAQAIMQAFLNKKKAS